MAHRSTASHVSGLPQDRLDAVALVERLFSVFSLIGSAFIFTTFFLSPRFRKPINRLIVWASVGNVLVTIATFISVSGMEAGATSALCHSQAFLIQFLLPADSFWSLAMATNVYLTFFKGYDANGLRRLEKWYAGLCYGLPFTVAVIYVIVDATLNEPIYGPAVIWCWVSKRFEWMRLAFFYGPVWYV